MVVVMVASAAALVVLVVAVIWYAGTRGRHAGLVSKRDFDAAYDDLTPSDRATRGDRESAWRDFHVWQVTNEEERRSWDDPEIRDRWDVSDVRPPQRRVRPHRYSRALRRRSGRSRLRRSHVSDEADRGLDPAVGVDGDDVDPGGGDAAVRAVDGPAEAGLVSTASSQRPRIPGSLRSSTRSWTTRTSRERSVTVRCSRHPQRCSRCTSASTTAPSCASSPP